MHQYKTVAQILLILSIFNLVFAAPFVQKIYNAHNDAVVPVAVRNVAATSKERRSDQGSDSDGTVTPSHSSLPPPDGPASSLQPPPDGSPSDAAPLHESPPPPPSEPAALEVSSPAGGTASLPVVSASGQRAPEHSTSAPQYTAVTHDMLDPPSRPSTSMLKKIGGTLGPFAIDIVLVAVIAGGVLWHDHHKHHRRTIDPDSPMAKGSRHPGLERGG